MRAIFVHVRAAAAMTLIVALAAPATAQSVEPPQVDTSIDQLSVALNDLDPSRPERVTWRTTGKVRSGAITRVASRTLGQPRYLDRAQLGEGIDPSYPITVRGRVSTPICDSSESAKWLSGSDFIGRGRSWVGLEQDRIDPFRGYFPSRAPNGSQAQWTELGVGGFDRYPPSPAKPGGRMEAVGLGSAFHNLTYLDPARACWLGGVGRVEARLSFGMAAIRAVGGDVALQKGDELPRFTMPIIDGASMIAVAFSGGVPGMVVNADVLPIEDEDGGNPELLVKPYVQSAGTWHETRPHAGGMDWQLRFYVIAYWDAPFLTEQEAATFDLQPGDRAIVLETGTGATERLRAEEPATLAFGGDEVTLLPASSGMGPNGTPFPTPNTCSAEPLAGVLKVRAPSRSQEAGAGIAARSPGVGDPSLAYATPPGFIGARLATDAAGIPTLEQVVVAGRELGSLALPHVRIDGVTHRLTTATRIEGPIAYEHTTAYGAEDWGYVWNSMLFASVHRVGDVELPLYWTIHARTQADSRGVGTCGVISARLDDVLNQADRDIELRWFVGVNLEGRGTSYAKQFRIGQGNSTVAQEKVCDRDKPFWSLVDPCHFLDLRDKQDPDTRWQFQEVESHTGYTALLLDKGTKAPDPRAEADGEGIDGAPIGLHLVEERGSAADATDTLGYNRHEVFSTLAMYLYPCAPNVCP